MKKIPFSKQGQFMVEYGIERNRRVFSSIGNARAFIKSLPYVVKYSLFTATGGGWFMADDNHFLYFQPHFPESMSYRKEA